MMKRRFKLVTISFEVVASWGKGFGKALKDQLPADSVVLLQKEEIFVGSLIVLVYNPEFLELDNDQSVPRMKFTMKPCTIVLN